MPLDTEGRTERRGGRSDRLDVSAEGIPLMLGPHRALARLRNVGEPAAAGTGDHGRIVPVDVTLLLRIMGGDGIEPPTSCL